jgi:hypothetical protein
VVAGPAELELACLVRALRARSFAWFAVALFFNGCHFGVHHFALLNLPVYAVLFLLLFRRKAWHWGACAALWMLGALPILIPIARYGMASGSLEAVIRSALFGEVFQQKILALDVREGPLWVSNMALASVSFMNPCWLYAAVVPLAAWRGRKGGRRKGGRRKEEGGVTEDLGFRSEDLGLGRRRSVKGNAERSTLNVHAHVGRGRRAPAALLALTGDCAFLGAVSGAGPGDFLAADAGAAGGCGRVWARRACCVNGAGGLRRAWRCRWRAACWAACDLSAAERCCRRGRGAAVP